MKSLLYIRVSTDEQAFGFSLLDQEKRLTDYCHKTGIEITAIFKDDFTGKTFERPGFKSLLTFLKANPVDFILFTKWSRFSRNTADSYQMIRKIETLGAKVQAIDEPVDMSIPQNKVMLSIYLAMPEIDNDMRADATVRGMRRANKEGRYVGPAPAGYVNQRDEAGRPAIVPAPAKAPIIRKAFELMATGSYSQHEVRMQLKADGLTFSRSRLSVTLQNPVYAGILHLKPYKEEKGEVIKGIHEPLISEELFYKVQDVLNGNRRNKKHRKQRKVVEALPLRGFLYCGHDHKMTGSCSHGRGGNYHYYHCKNETHCERHRADIVNDSFVDLLRSIKIKKGYAEVYRMTVEHFLKPDTSHIQSLQTKIEGQQNRLSILQDKFIDGLITPDDYQEIRTRYEATMFDLKSQLDLIRTQESDFSANFGKSLTLLENLPDYYQSASPETKQAIIGSTIAGKLYFHENKCRTPEFNPIISILCKPDADFRGLHKLQKGEILPLVSEGTPSESLSRTLNLQKGIQSLANVLKLVAA